MPELEEKKINIFTAKNQREAQAILAYLADNEIEATQIENSLDIQVRKRQAATAIALIQEYYELPGLQAREDATLSIRKRRRNVLRTIAILVIGMAIMGVIYAVYANAGK